MIPGINSLLSALGTANTVNNAVNAGQAVQSNGLDSGISSMSSGQDNLNVVNNIANTAKGIAPLLGPEGAAASMGIGLIQKIGGAIKKKKAGDLFPEQEDPELRALAQNFARRKRAFQTGTALNSQVSGIQSLNKQAINSAFNAGGGQAGINRIAQMTAQAMNALPRQALQGELAFGNQQSQIVNHLAQTKLEKSLLQYSQAQAEAAQLKTQGNRNLMSGLAKIIPLAPVDPSLSQTYPDLTQQQQVG